MLNDSKKPKEVIISSIEPTKVPIKIPEYQIPLFPEIKEPIQLEFDFGDTGGC